MGKLKLQTGVLSLKCVHYVEVKAVDKHQWDDKDSRYSEICVKGFQKRWNKRWNNWWWQIKVVKAHVKKHVFNSMYSINKAIIIIYYENLILYQFLQIIATNGSPQTWPECKKRGKIHYMVGTSVGVIWL